MRGLHRLTAAKALLGWLQAAVEVQDLRLVRLELVVNPVTPVYPPDVQVEKCEAKAPSPCSLVESRTCMHAHTTCR